MHLSPRSCALRARHSGQVTLWTHALSSVYYNNSNQRAQKKHVFHFHFCFFVCSPKYAAGQQCCYDKTGAQVLTSDSIGGSTPDRGHDWGSPPYKKPPKVPSFSHWKYDVITFYYCCLWSDNCEYYFTHRPSSDCRTYQPPKAGEENAFILYDLIHILPVSFFFFLREDQFALRGFPIFFFFQPLCSVILTSSRSTVPRTPLTVKESTSCFTHRSTSWQCRAGLSQWNQRTVKWLKIISFCHRVKTSVWLCVCGKNNECTFLSLSHPFPFKALSSWRRVSPRWPWRRITLTSSRCVSRINRITCRSYRTDRCLVSLNRPGWILKVRPEEHFTINTDPRSASDFHVPLGIRLWDGEQMIWNLQCVWHCL